MIGSRVVETRRLFKLWEAMGQLDSTTFNVYSPTAVMLSSGDEAMRDSTEE